jgi:prepilin-type N-terminal cleavage/methylation domain-containing protein
MKPFLSFRSRSPKLNSFTLVELLVVMGIIAILAGVLLSAGGAALRAAYRAKANNMAVQVQTAALGYYTEYSVYPVPSGTTADVAYTSGDATDWTALAQSLCGNLNAYNPTTTGTTTVPNTRGIAFLNLKKSDVDANGIPVNPINPYASGVNQYFNIAIDADYSGVLGDSGTASGAITNFSSPVMTASGNKITQGVAVWANCNTGTGTNNTFYVHTY